MRGGIDRVGRFFRPRFDGVVNVWEHSDQGLEVYPPRMHRSLDVDPRGNSRRALDLWTPSNQQSVDGGGVSTPCETVSPRGFIAFVPIWSEL